MQLQLLYIISHRFCLISIFHIKSKVAIKMFIEIQFQQHQLGHIHSHSIFLITKDMEVWIKDQNKLPKILHVRIVQQPNFTFQMDLVIKLFVKLKSNGMLDVINQTFLIYWSKIYLYLKKTNSQNTKRSCLFLAFSLLRNWWSWKRPICLW